MFHAPDNRSRHPGGLESLVTVDATEIARLGREKNELQDAVGEAARNVLVGDANDPLPSSVSPGDGDQRRGRPISGVQPATGVLLPQNISGSGAGGEDVDDGGGAGDDGGVAVPLATLLVPLATLLVPLASSSCISPSEAGPCLRRLTTRPKLCNCSRGRVGLGA
jgi:hypothetical protein